MATEDEDEFDAIDYARFYGLSVDYTTEKPDIAAICGRFRETFDQDLQDPPYELIANAVRGLTKERLAVSRDAALLLKEVQTTPEASVIDLIEPERRKRISDWKLELPILRTDDELDMLEFGHNAIPKFGNLKIPAEVTSKENDDGFEWPSKYSEFSAKFEEQARTEKLAVTKEALIYLQEAVRDNFTLDDAKTVEAENLKYKPVGRAHKDRKHAESYRILNFGISLHHCSQCLRQPLPTFHLHRQIKFQLNQTAPNPILQKRRD